MIGANHAALEDAKEILCGVGDQAVYDDICASAVPAVVDGLVRGESLPVSVLLCQK